MDFFSYEGAKRIGSENILVKVDQLIDWSRFSLLLKRAHIGKQLGPTGYDPLLLFKMPSAWTVAWIERSAAGRKS